MDPWTYTAVELHRNVEFCVNLGSRNKVESLYKANIPYSLLTNPFPYLPLGKKVLALPTAFEKR